MLNRICLPFQSTFRHPQFLMGLVLCILWVLYVEFYLPSFVYLSVCLFRFYQWRCQFISDLMSLNASLVFFTSLLQNISSGWLLKDIRFKAKFRKSCRVLSSASHMSSVELNKTEKLSPQHTQGPFRFIGLFVLSYYNLGKKSFSRVGYHPLGVRCK